MQDPVEVVQTFHRSIEQGHWDIISALLTDDFIFSGPTPEPLNKRTCISMHKALWGGFPDLQFNLQICKTSGNMVVATTRITGTHMGLLIPPVPGNFVTIQPTGKKIALSTETAEYTTRNGQLAQMHVQPNPGGGWPGIYQQLGIEPTRATAAPGPPVLKQ